MGHSLDHDTFTPKSLFDSVKDTLESFVVAFILAFTFKAFLLEAFVIPTGSMATTLYGQQITHTCSTCGFEYARGINTEDVLAARKNPGGTLSLRCPNCDTMYDHLPASRVLLPDSGDRILVWKWAFDLGLDVIGPKRWDVVVFKNPSNGTDNYIKRLVGLPGEILEIIDGEVYTVPIETLRREDPDLAEAFEELTDDLCTQRTVSRYLDRDLFLTRYAELNKRLLPFLRIQRKPPHAQRSLWLPIYDHDYHPAPSLTGRPRSPVGWEPVDQAAAEAWNTHQREMTFDSASETPLAIRFAGKPITDFMAYNYRPALRRSEPESCPVGDVRLSFVWIPEAGDGSLLLRTNRDRDGFRAEIHMDGTVTLDHLRDDLPGGRARAGQARLPVPIQAGRAYTIEFTNLDYRVWLAINGRRVLATKDAQYTPDLERGLAFSCGQIDDIHPTEVTIAARRLRCRLRHVRLDRDVYYRSPLQLEKQATDPVTGEIEYNPFYRWPGWGTAGMPILLRPAREIDGRHFEGEMFMLGDNSPNSKDSRRWWQIGPQLRHLGAGYQLGTVPRDQLVGKAFFVYWPAGYRPTPSSRIGLIPNVGMMRWIR